MKWLYGIGLALALTTGTANAADLPRHADTNANVRVVSPAGVTASYPGAASGALRTDVKVPPGSMGGESGLSIDPAGIGGLFGAPTPYGATNAVTLQPNGTTYAQNAPPVQAFASSAPNAGVDSAPAPNRPGYLTGPAFEWWTSTLNPCPWEYRRRLGC
ncbi:MAG: hypothetical protein IT562_13125 [Alphaproteobacteria bacterium]|nr:hypothetical protein [Alphaproteobacteria bacterium]